MASPTSNASKSPQNGEEWVSASEVAARLGVSVRAVQKRCTLGKMAARRVTTPGGTRWEIEARELGHEGANEPTNQTSEQDASRATLGREPANQSGSFDSRPSSFDAQEDANLDANPRIIRREPGANQTNELRELLEREREFSAFLKTQLEEANRNAAELRASLREALRAMPKQLVAPSPSGGAAPVVTPSATAALEENARNAPQRAQNGEGGIYGGAASNGAKTGEVSDGAGLSYGDIADELERRLNGT